MLAGASLSWRDEQGLLGDAVEHLGLVGRIDRADGDAVDAGRQQVVEDLLLLGGAAGGRHAERHVDVAERLLGLLGPTARDGPEVGGVVGHEGELEPFLAGGSRRLPATGGGDEAEANQREGSDLRGTTCHMGIFTWSLAFPVLSVRGVRAVLAEQCLERRRASVPL